MYSQRESASVILSELKSHQATRFILQLCTAVRHRAVILPLHEVFTICTKGVNDISRLFSQCLEKASHPLPSSPPEIGVVMGTSSEYYVP